MAGIDTPTPRTPAHRRLRKSIEKSTPLRSLVEVSSSGSPAKVPQRLYLRPATQVGWTTLPGPASTLAEENDMLRAELLKARRRDGEYETCLEASHAQLAMIGAYAETCRSRAVAALKKKNKGKGRRVHGTGWSWIVSDPQLLAEIERMDEERDQADREKAARREARVRKAAVAAQHREFMDARRSAWEAVKVEHSKTIAQWELNGRKGPKPTRLKQQEVYSMLGLDTEDIWNSVEEC